MCLYTKVYLISMLLRYSQETTILRSNFFIICSHALKTILSIYHYYYFHFCSFIQIIDVFYPCKMDDNEILFNVSICAYDIHVFWLCYNDVKIRDTLE